MGKWPFLLVTLVACEGFDDTNSKEQALEGVNISVKELVACGGMQYSAMRGLAGSVVSEAGYPDTAEFLFGEIDFERDGADYVTLLPGGVFTMRFGTCSDTLDFDVFSFSTYVADPVLEHPDSIDAWQAGDVDFALHFSGKGPLFELLDDGRGLQSPIRFRIYPDDVFALAWGNQLQGDLRMVFGPLFDNLQIESDLDFQDQREGVGVAYRMTTPPSSVLGLLDDGSLSMQIEELEAHYDGFVVRPLEVDVHYVDGYARGLAGSIRYGVYDSDDADEPVCRAVADYGAGAVYGDLSDDC